MIRWLSNLQLCRSLDGWLWIVKTAMFSLCFAFFVCKCLFRNMVWPLFAEIGRFAALVVADVVGAIDIVIMAGTGLVSTGNSGSGSDSRSITSTGEAIVEFNTWIEGFSFSGSNSNLSSTDVDDTSVFCGLASTVSAASVCSAFKYSLGYAVWFKLRDSQFL